MKDMQLTLAGVSGRTISADTHSFCVASFITDNRDYTGVAACYYSVFQQP